MRQIKNILLNFTQRVLDQISQRRDDFSSAVGVIDSLGGLHDDVAVENADAPEDESEDEAEEEDPPEESDGHVHEPVEEDSDEEGLEAGTALSLVRVDAHGGGSVEDSHKEDQPGVLGGGVNETLSFEHLCHFVFVF